MRCNVRAHVATWAAVPGPQIYRGVFGNETVEAEAPTVREAQVGFVLEVELQSKLPEATLVIGTASDATLLCLDRIAITHIVIYRENVEVVMVQDVESLRTEFEVNLLMNRERLAERSIDVPGSWPTEGIAGGHIGRERAPVGSPQQCWIAERVRRR